MSRALTTLVLRNLPEDVEKAEIRPLFSRNANSLHGVDVLDVTLAKQIDNDKCVGYGFVEFSTHEAAAAALQSAKNGLQLPGRQRVIEVDWAQGRYRTQLDEFQVYVGNLHPDMTEPQLYSLVSGLSTGVVTVKVIKDGVTGYSRGYGFIRYFSEQAAHLGFEKLRADFNQPPLKEHCLVVKRVYKMEEPSQRFNKGEGAEFSNTTVYIANIDSSISESQLKQLFDPFGFVLSIRIVPPKHIAFVTFADHVSALAALSHLNGQQLRQQKLQMSWGRSRPIPYEQEMETQAYEKTWAYNAEWHHSMTPYIPSKPMPQKPSEEMTTKEKQYWLSRLAPKSATTTSSYTYVPNEQCEADSTTS